MRVLKKYTNVTDGFLPKDYFKEDKKLESYVVCVAVPTWGLYLLWVSSNTWW